MDMGRLKNRLGRHMARDLALIRYPAGGKAYFSPLASPSQPFADWRYKDEFDGFQPAATLALGYAVYELKDEREIVHQASWTKEHQWRRGRCGCHAGAEQLKVTLRRY